MALNHDNHQHDKALAWRKQMQAMVVGAARGMGEAHDALTRQGHTLPPLDQTTMYQASVLLAATLLEGSLAHADDDKLKSVSRVVGREMLYHLEILREQRGQFGVPTLHKVLARAGLIRRRQSNDA